MKNRKNVLGNWVIVGTASLVGFSAFVSSAQEPPKEEDILGNIVVLAGGSGKALPKIGVFPSLVSDMEDVTLRSVVRRDLDLCGEFEVIADSAAPEGLYLSDTPVDMKAWSAKGAESVVRVSAKRDGNVIKFHGEVYFSTKGNSPVFTTDTSVSDKNTDLRLESHRVADKLIGAMTGQNGGFASHMAFASGTGTLRRVFTIDADGANAKAISPPEWTAVAPAFGKGEQLYYAGSRNNDAYKVLTESGDGIMTNVKGSVYGLAFSKDRSRIAASIGIGNSVRLYEGADFMSLKPFKDSELALFPMFTLSGKLAYTAEGKYGQRIYLDGKPISPDGLFASAPTFCNNPNGTRLVFAVGVGKNTDLVSANENGTQLARLTQNQGSNGYPACSPDGRLVAFFSTRKSNEGPGLYIMRLDGGRPKRISTLLGDSLKWDPIPVKAGQ